MYHSQFAFAVIKVFKRYVLLYEKIITAILTCIRGVCQHQHLYYQKAVKHRAIQT